jgi:hypothetical protein
METIESVQRAVRAWRRIHRRGPLPINLRRRVGELAAQLGEKDVRRAIGVRAAVIARWCAEYGGGVTRRARGGRSRFVELEPELVQPLLSGSKSAGLRLEVTGPGGSTIRIEGVRDGAEVVAIIRAALRAGNEA